MNFIKLEENILFNPLKSLTNLLRGWSLWRIGTKPIPIAYDLLIAKETLERILLKNIIPFWYPHCLDLELGGYCLNQDLQGRWQGKASKRLVTQARTVWFFAFLSQTSYGNNQHLKAARHGYEFLSSKLWDTQHGGFYWEVDASGNTVTLPDKHLYGQAFGLYALSEYAIVSGQAEASRLAEHLFYLLEAYAHDAQHGGYTEFFQRDWSSAHSECIGYLGLISSVKSMNTHLHLLEAITAYYLLTKDQLAKTRLIELITILSNTIVRKTIGACTDCYQADWTPLNGSVYKRVSYGHNLENVWLLSEACKAVGISNHLLLGLYQTLFEYSFRYGFDQKQGGLYDSGQFNRLADNHQKVWWVQAETLVTALQMYQVTEEETYLDYFHQILSWIDNYQIDWQLGEWHAVILPNGSHSGEKVGDWKSPYHNGRAVLQCLKILSLLENKYNE